MTPTQRAAAERLAFEQWYDAQPDGRISPWDVWQAAALLRELLAEPVQEPVAYIDQRQLAAGYVTLLCITRPEYRSYADVAEGIHYTPVYLHPPQQPMHCPKDGGECGAGGYCRPEQRKPLTDKEIMNTLKAQGTGIHWRLYVETVRAVERAHGITGEPT